MQIYYSNGFCENNWKAFVSDVEQCPSILSEQYWPPKLNTPLVHKISYATMENNGNESASPNILSWKSILRKLTIYGQHLLEFCHKTNEVWAYGGPRCGRPPEKADSISFRQETTTVNYLIESFAASGTQTSSLKASDGLSALSYNWQSLWVLNEWENQLVGWLEGKSGLRWWGKS